MSNDFAGTVSVIDAASNTVVATVPASGLLGLVVNPAGTRVYSGFGCCAAAVIDTATNTVSSTIPLPGFPSPQGFAINPAGTRVYISNTSNANVSVIDTATNTIIATVPVGNSDVTPDGLNVYVANSSSASVSVISTATNTVIATLPTGSGSAPFAFGKFIGGAVGTPPPPVPPAAPTDIPTLSEWGLLSMALLLALAGVFAFRRRATGR